MVDGWSGILGMVVVVAIKDVEVAFTEVSNVDRGAGGRNEEVVGIETGIGIWVITGLAVERMKANPAMLIARKGFKENCMFFFKIIQKSIFLGFLFLCR